MSLVRLIEHAESVDDLLVLSGASGPAAASVEGFDVL